MKFFLIKMYIYQSIKNPVTDIEVITPENRKYINEFKQFLNKTGSGLVNKILKHVPIPEMHLSLPSDVSSEYIENGSFNNTGKYSYCGPGTKVKKRLNQGYAGVNSLDKACKEHDLYYAKYKKTKERNIADDILANEASKIVLDPNEPEYVRKDAKLVTAIMSGKSKLGMGCPDKKLKSIYYNPKTGFSGVNELARKSNVSFKVVKR